MMKLLTAAVAAGGMTAVTLGLTASIVPTGEVEQTMRTLEASGYHVIVNHPDDALSSCSVGAVRQGEDHRATVYLDVTC